MIILDTNILSEVMRTSPDPAVVGWLETQPRPAIFTTAVTQAEILYGVRLLSESKRRVQLDDAIQAIFNEDFANRVLPFDASAAAAYAELAAARRQAGRPISQFDAQIAAIALSRGASLATRNVDDFSGIGLTLINPFGQP